MKSDSTSSERFTHALLEHASHFNVQLDATATKRLREYYELVLVWNGRLHLVAPCSPEEFATRHVLESLLALQYIKAGTHVIDVGSGGGLPVIPCLIARPDLSATLIESAKKKSVFLREALRQAGASERAKVICERFEKIETPAAEYVICRALEQFTEQFQTLVAWSPKQSVLLFFSGETLRVEIEKSALAYKAIRIPESERRFLFIIEHGQKSKDEG
jgi:16S rRNA (guanine(527)-N(7))-methyltransferase RsmG